MHLILYVKPGCHLCDEARLAITHTGARIELEARDITRDPNLMSRYGLRIPLLQRPDTGEELDWPFGPAGISTLTLE